MHNRRLLAAAALLGLMVATHETRADLVLTTPLPPSTANTSAAYNDGTAIASLGGTLLAFRNLTYDVVIGGGFPDFKGDVTEAVIKDTFTGGLDFFYQIHTAPDGSGNNRFTTTLFLDSVNMSSAGLGAGYTQVTTTNALLTTAGFHDATFVGAPPTIPAPFASRQSGDIGFQRTLTGELPAGDYSNILFVRTNATAFDPNGTLSVIDGRTAFVAAFEPAVVPEPSTVAAALTGLALCGVASLRRRFRKAS